MKTRTDTKHTIENLSQQWKDDHRELDKFFDEYRQWAYEIAQQGVPHFGETAERLKQLRERLTEHFAREDKICEQLIAIAGSPSPEVDANRRQVATDHINLLSRLDTLINRLGELDPPYDSWQEAVEEVERFCDALEQHEEQESDCITWLLPK